MNIFFVIGDAVVTPATEGAILRGITRNTLLHFLRDGGYRVETRPVSIDELVEAHRAGTLREAFGSGTAAVISHVSSILYGDYEIDLPPVEQRTVGPWLKDQINGVRSGRLPDTRGWLHVAGSYGHAGDTPAPAVAAPAAAA